jgi:hypothetical protein
MYVEYVSFQTVGDIHRIIFQIFYIIQYERKIPVCVGMRYVCLSDLSVFGHGYKNGESCTFSITFSLSYFGGRVGEMVW